MERFADGKFPPGLLNPGAGGGSNAAAGVVGEVSSWCSWVLGPVACSTNRRQFIIDLLFSTRGVWMLLPLSFLLLLLYRLVGPPEVRALMMLTVVFRCGVKKEQRE